MRRLLTILLFALLPLLAAADVSIPPLKARVTDLTATLQPAELSRLESKLAAIEAEKGSQIAVLILPSTQPETIEQYGIRVVDEWKLGRKGVDDGVLILLAKDDRATRIEVGYGLEGALPDVIAKRIIEEVMIPYFRAGDYYAGLDAGIERIHGVLQGEPLPPPKTRAPPAAGGVDQLLPLVLFAALGIGAVLRAIFGSFLGGVFTGGAVGVIAWLLGIGLVFALVIAVMAFFLTMSGAGVFLASAMLSRGAGGGMGGFGGGGGGFGGGGASGRW